MRGRERGNVLLAESPPTPLSSANLRQTTVLCPEHPRAGAGGVPSNSGGQVLADRRRDPDGMEERAPPPGVPGGPGPAGLEDDAPEQQCQRRRTLSMYAQTTPRRGRAIPRLALPLAGVRRSGSVAVAPAGSRLPASPGAVAISLLHLPPPKDIDMRLRGGSSSSPEGSRKATFRPVVLRGARE